jgi:drug/metabolite transporter (DMT)-like permease
MFYLNFLMGAFCSACLVIILRLFSRYNVPTFPAVVGNYITCVIIGVCMDFSQAPIGINAPSPTLFGLALALGGLFIVTFYMMGLSTNAVGVTVTTVFVKISMVIPILFSIFILPNPKKIFDVWNYLGLVLAGIAIVASSWKNSTPPPSPTVKTSRNLNLFAIALPLLVFAFSGIIDTSITALNERFAKPESPTTLPILIFAAAGSWGVLVLLIQFIVQKSIPPFRAVIGGIVLGTPNFFSLYFMVKSLSDFSNNGALFFPVFNIAIILFSALGGWLIFQEKLSNLNRLGVLLALVAIGMITYQDILK